MPRRPATTIDPRIATAARVEVVEIDGLRQWDRNPHRGSVDDVRASLRRFGQVTPIVRAPDGWIIAGNTTLQAMIEEGYSHCATVTLDAEESEQVAYGLASNQTARLGEDDDAKVLALLRELEVLEGTGYTDDDVADLNALLQELAAAETPLPHDGPRTALNDEGVSSGENTMGQYLDGYQASGIRSIVLDYDLSTFAWLAERAERLRAEIGVDTNSALFVALIADRLNEQAP